MEFLRANQLDFMLVMICIEKGKGTQFDPVFAGIMLELMDKDTDYRLQQDDEQDV